MAKAPNQISSGLGVPVGNPSFITGTDALTTSREMTFPMTKFEARRAAAALFDDGPTRRNQGLTATVQPRSLLQKPGKSRRSLIETSQEVRAALRRALDHFSDYQRRFLYLDLAPLGSSERSDLVCYMLASRKGSLPADGHDTTLTIAIYYVDPRFLRQEPAWVRHFAAMGWQVSRRRVETPGHAVDLLTRRIQALGWA